MKHGDLPTIYIKNKESNLIFEVEIVLKNILTEVCR